MGLKRWLQKWLIGIDLDTFVHSTVILNDTISSEVATLYNNQKQIVELVNTIARQSGGEGWVPTVQNAISNLDKRIEKLAEVVSHHQETMEAMFEEDEKLVDLALHTEKDKAN